MGNRFIKTFLLIISLVLFTRNVYAECSYQDRKEILNAAEKIKISLETIDNGNYSFSYKFYVSGVTKDLFITYYNTNDGEEKYISYENTKDGIYSFIDNETFGVYTYIFEISSVKSGCYINSLTKKRVKKPMYNIYSENVNCSVPEYSNFKYCKKFFEEDYHLTDDKFYDALFSYSSNTKTEDKAPVKDESFFEKNLLVIILVPSIVILGIVIFIILKRKKSEL